MHERADELGIEVRTPKSLRDADEQGRFRGLDADLAVVAAYGLILPTPILEAPKAGCINVHASLLPHWRGAAPIQRAILAGDEISGVTLMRMDEGLDTGPMLARQTLDIRGKTAGQVTEEMAVLGARMLVEWLQRSDLARAAADRRGDLCGQDRQSRGAHRLERPAARDRAPGPRLQPDAGCLVRSGRRARSSCSRRRSGPMRSGKPGEVLDDCLTVAAGDGYVRPLKVQRAGRSPMTAGELLRGFPIAKGTILT